MSWLGKLFGTQKAIDDVMDKDNGLMTQFGGWIGNMNYTEEERAKAVERTREWGIRQLDAMSQFKVVQRILAFSVAFLWVFVAVNLVVMIWLNHPQLDTMKEFAFSDYVWVPTLLVFGLYFGGGVVDSIKRKMT